MSSTFISNSSLSFNKIAVLGAKSNNFDIAFVVFCGALFVQFFCYLIFLLKHDELTDVIIRDDYDY